MEHIAAFLRSMGELEMAAEVEQASHRLNAFAACVDRSAFDATQQAAKKLLAENEALCRDKLTPLVFQHLLDWLREDPIRPASAAFSEGIERQIAYLLEHDVLPEVKSLRLRLSKLSSRTS